MKLHLGLSSSRLRLGSSPPWLHPGSCPYDSTGLPRPSGSPWSVSNPSAALHPSTPSAPVGFSFPPAPPWSSVAPPSPQSSGSTSVAHCCPPVPSMSLGPVSSSALPGSPPPSAPSQSLVTLVPSAEAPLWCWVVPPWLLPPSSPPWPCLSCVLVSRPPLALFCWTLVVLLMRCEDTPP